MSDATLATKQPRTVRDWLSTSEFKNQVGLALPKHLTPDRFLRVALTALNRTPKLTQCTKESVFQCLLDLSALGLEPDGRRAHLIPYGDKCTLIIDYKGLIELAKRNGDVKVIRAFEVCENDKFSWSRGEVTHEVDWLKPRGKMLAVYSHVKMADGFDDFEVMTDDECEAIRKRSRAGNSGPWITDRGEMCKKTVIRRHSKRLTLSPEFHDAMQRDGDSDATTIEDRVAMARQVTGDSPIAEPESPMLPEAVIQPEADLT